MERFGDTRSQRPLYTPLLDSAGVARRWRNLEVDDDEEPVTCRRTDRFPGVSGRNRRKKRGHAEPVRILADRLASQGVGEIPCTLFAFDSSLHWKRRMGNRGARRRCASGSSEQEGGQLFLSRGSGKSPCDQVDLVLAKACHAAAENKQPQRQFFLIGQNCCPNEQESRAELPRVCVRTDRRCSRTSLPRSWSCSGRLNQVGVASRWYARTRTSTLFCSCLSCLVSCFLSDGERWCSGERWTALCDCVCVCMQCRRSRTRPREHSE